MNKTDSSEAGFTIVELLVSLFVGTSLIISLSSITVSHSKITAHARDLIIANAFIEAQVEGVRSAGFLTLNDGTTNITSSLPSELAVPRTASRVISTQAAGVKRVTYSLTYNSQGTPRSFSYTTYVGELGVGQY